eukprot:4854977-Pyramimonas_sp.AAC.2
MCPPATIHLSFSTRPVGMATISDRAPAEAGSQNEGDDEMRTSHLLISSSPSPHSPLPLLITRSRGLGGGRAGGGRGEEVRREEERRRAEGEEEG